MSANLTAFNIHLLIPTTADVKNIPPIKALDIFTASSSNFHPDGLFSTEIFGKVGEEKRSRMYSWMELHIGIFHPVVYKALCDLKVLYGDIMASKAFAVFDSTLNDFVKSNAAEGETGYAFFLSHFDKLKFEVRPSSKRQFNIALIEKYRDDCLMDKLIVMPAGLRDYTMDDNGKPSEDEINGLYRKVLAISGMISNVNAKANNEYLNSARYNLQLAISAIYEYIKNLMEGKSKLIMGKWASRNISNTTRNVITSYIPKTETLHGPTTVSVNQSVLGMYQYLRNILPLAVKNTRDTYLTDVFVGPNTPAILVNKKTLKKEMVTIDPEHYDDWMTYEGLEKLMALFGEEDLRHVPVDIGGYYIGLLYKGKDGTYRFTQGIDDLPEDRDPKDLYPITFAELLYLSNYKDANRTPVFVTRYPITGYGSVYPSYVYLKSTVKSEVRRELGHDWQETGDVANEFPITGAQFYNSMSVHTSHLPALGADKS